MKKIIKYLFVFLFLCILFIPNTILAVFDYEKIFYLSKAKEKEGIASIKKNYQKIDILAPQLYGIYSDLKVKGGFSKELKAVIEKYNLKVMPLVANYGFNQKIIHDLLISDITQNEVIKFLVDTAIKEKYIGWQYDFENIDYKDRDLFSSFVEKTAKEFKTNNLILSTALVARHVDYEDTSFYNNWSGVFDYKRIASAVDFVSLMTYDDPNSTGPVASIPFVKESLDYVKDKIPSNKLSLGIPFYYWGWSTSPLKRVRTNGTYQRIIDIESTIKHKRGFDKELGVSWLSYIFNKKEYKIWFDDLRSYKTKIAMIKDNNLRGFSAWVLGSEDQVVWKLFNEKAK